MVTGATGPSSCLSKTILSESCTGKKNIRDKAKIQSLD
jgi:hypothetical protein